MMKRKMLTAALMAVGVFVSLEPTSVAQTNDSTSQSDPNITQPSGTMSPQPDGSMTQPGGTMSPQPGGSMTQPGGTMSPQPSGSTTQPTQTNLSAFDRQFMIQAAQGGMAEVRLGQLAAQRAASSEVKQYAQRMINEHTQANKELMALAAQKSVTLPKDVNAKQKALRAKLGQIPAPRLDQVYMNEAGVKSHAEQAALFQREAEQGQDPDVKAFAAKILPTVQEHLQMARSMTNNTTGANPTRPATAQ